LALVAANPAAAGTVPFMGSLTLQIFQLAPIGINGSGVASFVGEGAHPGSLSLPASPFDVAGLVVPVSDPAAFPIKGLDLTLHNGAGHFQGAVLSGAMPLGGVAKVCLFAPCASASANITVPLSVIGDGGTRTASGLVDVTIGGAPWTAGVAAIGTLTQQGFSHGPASNTSSTVGASGQLRLVTPIFISTNIAAASVIPAFGILNLHFVPEPSQLLLIGGGAAGLVVADRAQRRERASAANTALISSSSVDQQRKAGAARQVGGGL
jgi:hypothetical protein